MLNRFAVIFYHYYGGALLGFRQRFWPEEIQYGLPLQLLAMLLYLTQLLILLLVPLPKLVLVGLAMILFSPQWVYCLHPLPHPVFEFRGYGMSIGIALISSWFVAALPVLGCSLVLVWVWASYTRRRYLTNPLLFWSKVLEESHHAKLRH